MNLDHKTQAQHWIDLAEVAMAAEQFDVASNCLRRGLRLCPDMPQGRIVEARLHLRLNQGQEALAALDAHDLAHPDRRGLPQVGFLRARALIASGRRDMARSLVSKLVHEYPDDQRPHQMLAAISLDDADAKQAIKHLASLVKLRPTDQAARRTLANQMAELDPQGAIHLLLADRGQRSQPTTRLLLARLYKQVDRLREAEECYGQLMRDCPDDEQVWLEAGQLADAMGADEAAQRRLQHAITLAGSVAATQTIAALARVHMHAGRARAAGLCWWKLAHRDGSDVNAWAGLLVCALADKRAWLAMRVRTYLDERVEAGEARLAISQQWQHMAGGEQLNRIQEGELNTPAQPKTSLAHLLKKSVKTLEKRTAQHSDRADGHFHLAVCQQATGQKQQAEESVQRALQINPRYSRALKLADTLTTHASESEVPMRQAA